MTTIVQTNNFSIHQEGCNHLAKFIEAPRVIGDFDSKGELFEFLVQEQVNEFQEPDNARTRELVAEQFAKDLKPCTKLK